MVAEETAGGPVGGLARFRLRWLASVVAIMAVLTAGWPLVNSAVADRQPLAAGSKVTIGSGRSGAATVTVGTGWYVQPAQSDPAQQYLLRHGAVVLMIRHLSLIDRHQDPYLWGGMRQILALADPGARLGKPVTITTAQRLSALTGPISGRMLSGSATIVPSPSREFAIGLVVLARRGASQAMLATARGVVDSLRFPVAGP